MANAKEYNCCAKYVLFFSLLRKKYDVKKAKKLVRVII